MLTEFMKQELFWDLTCSDLFFPLAGSEEKLGNNRFLYCDKSKIPNTSLFFTFLSSFLQRDYWCEKWYQVRQRQEVARAALPCVLLCLGLVGGIGCSLTACSCFHFVQLEYGENWSFISQKISAFACWFNMALAQSEMDFLFSVAIISLKWTFGSRRFDWKSENTSGPGPVPLLWVEKE